MAESRVKDGNYYVVQSFMVKELALKGVELGVFAIIYGLCQNNQEFNGSRQYLADWLCATKQSIDNALKSLCEKGLITKKKWEENGVPYCAYRSIDAEEAKKLCYPKNLGGGSKETCLPQPKNLGGGSQIICPNNIGDITEEKTGETITPPEPPKATRRKTQSVLTKAQQETFDRFWQVYPKRVARADAEKAWKKIDPAEPLLSQILSAVTTAIKVDHRFRETRFTPYPASWLNGREWENEYETGGQQNADTQRYSTGFRTDF